jgi:hypothetical protein
MNQNAIEEAARLIALALSHLVTAATVAHTDKAEPEPAPVLLDLAQASALLNIKPIALRRSKRFRSARRDAFGSRTLRFDRAALLRIVGRS